MMLHFSPVPIHSLSYAFNFKVSLQKGHECCCHGDVAAFEICAKKKTKKKNAGINATLIFIGCVIRVHRWKSERTLTLSENNIFVRYVFTSLWGKSSVPHVRYSNEQIFIRVTLLCCVRRKN